MTKEQEADCQMVADSITYIWNPIYIVSTGSRRGSQSTQKEVSANIELHLEQDWYHGKLGAGCGGRHIAEQRVMEYCAEMEAPDGSFLVRESGTYVGDYVLSIWWDGKVQHIHIRWQQDADVHRFFLTDNLVFDSLYDLITHYKEMPMRYNGLEMRLTEPVPRPNARSNTDWKPRDGTRETGPASAPSMAEQNGGSSTAARTDKRVTFNKARDQVHIV